MPTNGNAGAALAAYGSRAGMETYIVGPADTPEVNVREIALPGGKVWRVNGLIDDCGKIVGAGKEPMGWFDVSTLKELGRRWLPSAIEGAPGKGGGHRALADIRESIAELRYYRTAFLRPPPQERT